MSDVLLPLRHVYGLEPHEALRPGDTGYGEQEALRELHEVLDTLPLQSPSAGALEAVSARALEPAPHVDLEAESSVERAVLDQSVRALDRLNRPSPNASTLEAVLARAAELSVQAGAAVEGESPVEQAVMDQSLRALSRMSRRAPAASALEAVQARAAEASAQSAEAVLEAASPVEAAVLEQSAQALDRLARSAPPTDVVDAVLAFAAAPASGALEAVRHVYADGPVGDAIEVAVLEQSRAALEQAFNSRPQPRPSTERVDAILARAAEASGLTAPPILEATSPVEAAALAQSHLALDRLPRASAPAAALDAVRIAAATATNDAAPAATPEPVPVAPPSSRTGWWAGAGALVLAALAAIAILPNDQAEVAALEDAPAVVAVLEDEPQPEASVETEAEETSEPEVVPSSNSPLVASAAVSGFVPVREVRRQASTPRTIEPPPQATLAPSAVAAAAEAAPAWDAPDDVRALSMRLEDLDLEDAIDWEEPAETFGVPAARTRTAAPGIQAVREGAAPAPAITPDSTRQR